MGSRKASRMPIAAAAAMHAEIQAISPLIRLASARASATCACANVISASLTAWSWARRPGGSVLGFAPGGVPAGCSGFSGRPPGQ